MTSKIRCDECGRSVERIHRRYQETGYCGSCYARVFKPAACPNCGKVARIPVNVPGAVCSECIANKPCLRCGRSGRPLGLIRKKGIVCNSCSPYFRELEHCEVCDRLSNRLTKIARFKDKLRRCERCAVADFGTCRSCRRHRKLVDKPGVKLCEPCSLGQQAHCDECGCLMPLARGRKCEECYWKGLFERRVRINRECLESTYWRDAFDGFGSWLINDVGAHKAALSISRFSKVFEGFEQRRLQNTTHRELLTVFGPDYLRRNQKVVQWMVSERRLMIEKTAKAVIAEYQRIERIISRVPNGSTVSLLVRRFWKMQEARYVNSEVSILTVRLSLTPAVAYLKLGNFQEPTSRNLAKYLSLAPGQRASIMKFISFLNSQCGYEIELPKKKRNKVAKKTELEKQLISMATDNAELDLPRWCELAVAVFHGVKVSRGKIKSGKLQINKDQEGYCVEVKGKAYFVPSPNS